MDSMINIEGISRSREEGLLIASACQTITHILESKQEQETIRAALRTLAKIVKLPNDQRTISISDSTFTSNPDPKDNLFDVIQQAGKADEPAKAESGS